MGTTALALLFTAASASFGLPSGLLSALCWVESTHNVRAYHMDDGKGNSVGLCQVKLDTAKYLGFKGTEKQLMDPHVNVYYAAKMLKKQLTRYSGNKTKAFAAYNAGSFRPSINGLPRNYKYVVKVNKAWKEHR